MTTKIKITVPGGPIFESRTFNKLRSFVALEPGNFELKATDDPKTFILIDRATGQATTASAGLRKTLLQIDVDLIDE